VAGVAGTRRRGALIPVAVCLTPRAGGGARALASPPPAHSPARPQPPRAPPPARALTRPLAALLHGGRLEGDLPTAATEPRDGAAAGLQQVEYRRLALLKLAAACQDGRGATRGVRAGGRRVGFDGRMLSGRQAPPSTSGQGPRRWLAGRLAWKMGAPPFRRPPPAPPCPRPYPGSGRPGARGRPWT
jgi:hypothetical protein